MPLVTHRLWKHKLFLWLTRLVDMQRSSVLFPIATYLTPSCCSRGFRSSPHDLGRQRFIGRSKLPKRFTIGSEEGWNIPPEDLVRPRSPDWPSHAESSRSRTLSYDALLLCIHTTTLRWALMPNLGSFLKKKRTKESPYPNDFNSANSAVGNSPTTPTSSGGFKDMQPITNTPSQPPQTQQSHIKGDESSSLQDHVPTSVPRSAEQDVAVSQAPTQNVTSIKYLINPPQTDGAGHSRIEDHSNGSETKSPEVKKTEPTSTPAVRTTKGKYTLSDFAIQRTLGTGSFGRVHLVQSNHNQRFYAVKVLKKQQVVKMKQVEHTNDERRMLQRVKHPFLVTLWGTFQDSKNLYMVMDFVEGGELFSLLRKSQVGDMSYCVV